MFVSSHSLKRVIPFGDRSEISLFFIRPFISSRGGLADALKRTVSGKPRTTDLRPWLWGAALTGMSEHSSPRLRTGRSVVRGKPCLLRRAQSRWGFQRGEAAALPFGLTRGFKPRVRYNLIDLLRSYPYHTGKGCQEVPSLCMKQ